MCVYLSTFVRENTLFERKLPVFIQDTTAVECLEVSVKRINILYSCDRGTNLFFDWNCHFNIVGHFNYGQYRVPCKSTYTQIVTLKTLIAIHLNNLQQKVLFIMGFI